MLSDPPLPLHVRPGGRYAGHPARAPRGAQISGAGAVEAPAVRRARFAATAVARFAAAAEALLAAVAPLAAAVAVLAAVACARPGRPEHPRNVIFILVDTLRADHLPLYGYRRDTAPALSALAGESLLFASARSQSACTFPSVNSLLTSRYPAAFLGQPGGAMGLPPGIPGLAEILRRRGFRTVAISASPVVRKSPSRFNPGGGYDRGFERFDEECLWKPADCVVRRARQEIGDMRGIGETRETGGSGEPGGTGKLGGTGEPGGPQPDRRPLLLYLHFMDPHGPYLPPPYHRRRFALGRPEKEFVRQGDPNPIARWLYSGGPDPGLSRSDLAYLVDLYDDKIAFFDSQLGLLLAGLRRTGLLEQSILVFAADHGEEFLEHGQVKHCRNVFDTSVRVPLVLRIPGVRHPGSIATPVQNLDIVPTVLDYLGFAPAAGSGGSGGGGGGETSHFEGRSLRAVIERSERGETGERDGRGDGGERGQSGERGERGERGAGGAGSAVEPPAYAYQWSAEGTERAVADGRLKLVFDLASGRFSLYDLLADPGETRDVLASRRRDARRLRQAMISILARSESPQAGAGLHQASEAENRLRSLGYLE